MIALLWIFAFFISIAILAKSAGKFIDISTDLARKLGISEFLIGITIVAVGTSLPELVTSLIAVLQGESALAADNIIGSNIANILLIIGISAIAARTLVIHRDLINLDMPLLATTQALLIFSITDSTFTLSEGILLIIAYCAYLHYTLHVHSTERIRPMHVEAGYPKLAIMTLLTLAIIIISAQTTITSLLKSAQALGINSSLLAITALAVGTSLPELMVSLIAALKKQHELSIGNIIGSNIFNTSILGLLSFIQPLPVSPASHALGIPYLIAATALLILSSISKKIHHWEGIMYLLIYALFVTKLFL